MPTEINAEKKNPLISLLDYFSGVKIVLFKKSCSLFSLPVIHVQPKLLTDHQTGAPKGSVLRAVG